MDGAVYLVGRGSVWSPLELLPFLPEFYLTLVLPRKVALASDHGEHLACAPWLVSLDEIIPSVLSANSVLPGLDQN